MAVKTNYSKNGNSYYRVTLTIGKKADGRPVRKEFYGKSKKEAEAKKEQYLFNLRRGLAADYTTAELGGVMSIWLYETQNVSNKIKPSTFQRYESIYRNYVKDSELHNLKLCEIKPLVIQRYYNKLYKSGKSSSCIFTLNAFMRSFFNYAVNEQYLLSNPCAVGKVAIPGKDSLTIEDERIQTFSNEDITKIKDGLKGRAIEPIFLTALGTGLRQGELLALTWQDVDLANNELRVNKTLKRVVIIEDGGKKRSSKNLLQTPKTKSSIRAVPLPPNLSNYLRSHLTEEKEKFLANGIPFYLTAPVFTTSSCHYFDARNLLHTWRVYLKKIGVSYKKFHCLRHTYATLLFENDVPLKTVQTLLGHASINTTAQIYTHVAPKEKIKAAHKLDKIFTDKNYAD